MAHAHVEIAPSILACNFAKLGDEVRMVEQAGAEVLHAPREFPEYHPGYYGVFLRDPDGHNVEAVHHG